MKNWKNVSKRLLSMLLTIIMLIMPIVEPVAASQAVDYAGVSFSEANAVKIGLSTSSAKVNIGEKYKLSMKGITGNIIWNSSNKSVATVASDGTVYGKKVGKTVITALAGGISYKCDITVRNLGMEQTSFSITEGKTKTIKVIGGSIKSVKSSKPSVATITKNGKLTALKAGNTTITITSQRNKKYSISVTVKTAPIYVNIGQKKKMTGNSVSKNASWTSSNKTVAIVDEKGYVYGLKAGTTVITAKDSQTSYKYNVTVRNLGLEQTEVTLVKGDKQTVHIVGGEVRSAASNDENIVTIDNTGKIKAVNPGKATLTIFSRRGKKYLLYVTVLDTISDRTRTLAKGDKFTLKLTATTIKSAESTKPSVATVDAKGKVTAIARGAATIKLTGADGKKYSCRVIVQTPSISKKILEMKVGDAEILELKNNSQKITWTSSDKKVATVTSVGKVRAKGSGTATITAKVESGAKFICKVTVADEPAKLKEDNIVMFQNEEVQLELTKGTIVNAVSNSKIIIVTPSGLVSAYGTGEAEITVTDEDGKTYKAKVKVEEPSLNYKEVTMNLVQKRILYVIGNSQKITWKSEDESIVTVDQEGVLSGKAAGETTVTATLENGFTMTCAVKVIDYKIHVSFKCNLEEVKMPQDAEIDAGTLISSISVPTKPGYTFVNWYYDEALTQPADDNTPILEDVVLYAEMVEVDNGVKESDTVASLGTQDENFKFVVSVIGPKGETFGIKEGIDEADYVEANVTLIDASQDTELSVVVTSLGEHKYAIEPEDGFVRGLNYELHVEDVFIVYEGKIKEDYVKIHYASLYKPTTFDVQMNDSIIYIKADQVLNLGSLSPILEVNPITGESEKTSRTGNFVYAGGESIAPGSVVCIYTDERPDIGSDAIFTGGEVMYVNITSKDGNNYNYETSDYKDVVFVPDTIPADWSQDLIPGDGDNKITLYKKDYEFHSGSTVPFEIGGQNVLFSDLGLNEASTIGVGDNLALVQSNGRSVQQNSTPEYARIQAIEYGELNGQEVMTFSFKAISQTELMESSSAHGEQPLEIDDSVIAEHKDEFIAAAIEQITESEFLKENADDIMLSALQTDEATDILESHGLSLANTPFLNENNEILNGEFFDAETAKKKGVSAYATAANDSKWEMKHCKVIPRIGTSLEHYAGESGVRLTLEIATEFELTVHENDGQKWKLVFTVNVDLEQEVVFGLGFDSSIVWKKFLFIPLPVDYRVDVTLRTGIFSDYSVEANVTTAFDEDYEFDEDDDDNAALQGAFEATDKFLEKTKDKLEALDFYGDGDPYYDTLKEKLEDVKEKIPEGAGLEKYLPENNDIDDVGGNGFKRDFEETLEEYDGDLEPREIEVIYKDTLEKAGDGWMELLKQEAFSYKLRLLAGIICVKFEIGFVVRLTGSITVGIHFGAQSLKEYTVTVRVLSFSASTSTRTIEEEKWDFSMYAVGVIGLRAGVYVEFAVGLFDTDLDSVGVTLELGIEVMLYMYGGIEAGSGKDVLLYGNIYLPISFYVEANAEAQVGKGKFSTTFKLVDWKWLIFGAGSKYVVRGFLSDSMVEMECDAGLYITTEYMRRCIALNMEDGELSVHKLPIDYFKVTVMNKVVLAGEDSKKEAVKLLGDTLYINDEITPKYYVDVKFTIVKGLDGNGRVEKTMRIYVTNATNIRILNYQGIKEGKFPIGEKVGEEWLPENVDFPEDAKAGYKDLRWEPTRRGGELQLDKNGKRTIMPNNNVYYVWKGTPLPRPLQIEWYTYNGFEDEYILWDTYKDQYLGYVSDQQVSLSRYMMFLLEDRKTTSKFDYKHDGWWTDYQPKEFLNMEEYDKVEFVSGGDEKKIISTEDEGHGGSAHFYQYVDMVTIDRWGKDILRIYGRKQEYATYYDCYDVDTGEKLDFRVISGGYDGDTILIPDFENAPASTYFMDGVSFAGWLEKPEEDTVIRSDLHYKIYVKRVPTEFTVTGYFVGSAYSIDKKNNITRIDLAKQHLPVLYRRDQSQPVTFTVKGLPGEPVTEEQLKEMLHLDESKYRMLTGMSSYEPEMFSDKYVIQTENNGFKYGTTVVDSLPMNIMLENVERKNISLRMEGLVEDNYKGGFFAPLDVLLFEYDVRSLRGVSPSDVDGYGYYRYWDIYDHDYDKTVRDESDTLYQNSLLNGKYKSSVAIPEYWLAPYYINEDNEFVLYQRGREYLKKGELSIVHSFQNSRTGVWEDGEVVATVEKRSGDMIDGKDYIEQYAPEVEGYILDQNQESFVFGARSNNTLRLKYKSAGYYYELGYGPKKEIYIPTGENILEAIGDSFNRQFYNIKEYEFQYRYSEIAWQYKYAVMEPEDAKKLVSGEYIGKITPRYEPDGTTFKLTFDGTDVKILNPDGEYVDSFTVDHIYGVTKTDFPEYLELGEKYRMNGWIDETGKRYGYYWDENGNRHGSPLRPFGETAIVGDHTFHIDWTHKQKLVTLIYGYEEKGKEGEIQYDLSGLSGLNPDEIDFILKHPDSSNYILHSHDVLIKKGELYNFRKIAEYALEKNTHSECVGWSLKPGGEINPELSGDYYSDGTEYVLFPVWERKDDTVVLHPNNGEEDIRIIIKYGETCDISDFKVEKKGFTFTGWYNNLHNTEQYLDGNSTKIEGYGGRYYEFTAGWSPNQYNINYVTNGGSFTTNYYPKIYINDRDMKLPRASDIDRRGYAFEGWYDNAECTGNPKTSLYTVVEEDITLYAKWVPKEYTLSLDANGGTLYDDQETDSVKFTILDTVELPVPTKTGCVFAGWDCKEMNWYSKMTDRLPESVAGNVSLKAVWKVIVNVEYTVSHYLKNSKGTTQIGESKTYTCEAFSEIVLRDYAISVEHADFLEVLPVDMSLDEVYTIGEKNVELRYYYLQREYDLTLKTSEKETFRKETLTEGDKLDLSAVPEKEGYTFTGWYLDKEATKPMTETVMGREDITLYAGWSQKVYKITYILGEGTEVEGELPKEYKIETPTITLPVPTRKGYRFILWAEKDGKSTAEMTIPTGSTGDKEFEAVWELQTYAIELHGEYTFEDGVKIPSEYNVTSNEIVIPEPLERTGMVFTGWSNGEDETLRKNVVIPAGSTGKKISLTANWDYVVYNITYELNGGTNHAENPKTYTMVDSITLKVPTREGYEFLGWFEGEDAVSYISNSTGDRTFTAKWEERSGVISYSLDGGALPEGKENPTEFVYSDAPFTLVNPEKEGYTFLGWTSKDNTTPALAVTVNPAELTGAVVYTANWEVIAYKLTVELNGGTIAQEIPTTYTIKDDIEITAVPKRTGATFVNWKLEDGNTTLRPRIMKGSTGDRTFKAVWSLDTYTITYKLDGGTNNGSNPSTYTVESKDIVLAAPVKEHAQFIGWTYDDVKDPQMDVTISAGSTGSKTFTANWKMDSYKITYKLGGGEFKEIVKESYTAGDAFEQNIIPEKEGYTFYEWDETHSKTVAIYSNTTGEQTFTAIWTPVEYKITYEMDGVETPSSYPEYYTIESKDITLEEPVKPGYTFLGWTYGTVTEPVKEAGIPAGSMGEITFTAHWELTGYTVKYEGVENSTGTGNNPATYNVTSQAVVLANPEKTGYDFIGWTYGSVTTPETSVTLDPAKFEGDITFTANWALTKYDITYVLGSEDAVNDNTVNPVYYTVETAVTFAAATRPGYDFAGWYNGTTEVTEITKGSTGALTLTAKWTAKAYKITYVLGAEDVVNDNPATYTVVDGDVVLKDPTRNGYLFLGWLQEDQTYLGNNTILAETQAEITLTADWEIIEYGLGYELHDGALEEGKTNPMVYTVTDENFTLNNPVKAGYSFKGWTYEGQDTPVMTVTIDTSSAKAYNFEAHWGAEEYSITYMNVDDAVFETENPDTYQTGDSFLLKNPSKEGYTFKGWKTTENGAASEMMQVTADMNGDLIFYAEWSLDTYTVIFESDGEELGDDTYSVEDLTVTIPTGLQKDGYELKGWNVYTEDADQTLISENGTIPSGTIGDLRFVAVWGAITYKISYQGVDDLTGYPEEYTADSNEIKLADPEKEYYTFAGWTDEDENPVEGTIPSGSTGDKTFAATWDAVKFTIGYTLNGGSMKLDETTGKAEENLTEYTVETKDFTLKNPEKENYVFAGWTDDDVKDADAETSVTITEGSHGNRSFTAAWTPEAFGITYDYAEGELEEGAENPKDYTVETETFTLVKPVRKGYDFDGWMEGTSSTTVADVTITKGTSGEKKYTATWKLAEYGITYELSEENQEVNASANPSAYTIEDGTIVLEDPTKEGYKFTGWTIKDADGNIISPIEPSTPAGTIPAGTTGNLTATPGWAEKGKYTITYELGTNGTRLEEYSYAEEFEEEYAEGSILLGQVKRDGYMFTGWKVTAASGTDIEVSIQNSILTTGLTENLTATAQWEANTDTPYTVTIYRRDPGAAEFVEVSTDRTKTGTTDEELTISSFIAGTGNFTAGNLLYAKSTATGDTELTADSKVALAGDGSLVISLYYEFENVNKITVTYLDNDGTFIDKTAAEAYTKVYREGEAIIDTNEIGAPVLDYTPDDPNDYTYFVGWAYTQGATEADIIQGKLLAETEDVTLYAVWFIESNVNWNSNGMGIVISGNEFALHVEPGQKFPANFTAPDLSTNNSAFEGWGTRVVNQDNTISYVPFDFAVDTVPTQAELEATSGYFILYAIWSDGTTMENPKSGSGGGIGSGGMVGGRSKSSGSATSALAEDFCDDFLPDNALNDDILNANGLNSGDFQK